MQLKKETDANASVSFTSLKKDYFLASVALISIEIAERSIFNFPDIVSITTVVSASSETLP